MSKHLIGTCLVAVLCSGVIGVETGLAEVQSTESKEASVAPAALAVEAPASQPAPAVEPQAPPTVPTPAPVVQEKSPEEKKRDEARATLNGTSWTAQLRSDKTGKTYQDTLTFQGRTVSSAWLSKAGYGSSNYSPRVEEDVVVWETMQSKEGEGPAFWRGEVQGMKMSGVLNKQPAKGEPESFTFTAVPSGQPSTPMAAPVAGTKATSASQAAAVDTSRTSSEKNKSDASNSKKKKKKRF